MFVIEKKGNEMHSLPAKELLKDDIGAISSELSQKIVGALAKEPLYPAELAKRLKVHEQKVYYHIRNLEKAGVIEIVKKETKQGAVANYYGATSPAYVVRFKEMEQTNKIAQMRNEASYLEPFIEN
ncbi:MAG TPA: helix-turn-helix domain-containing protein, partial [Candidatus Nanoarchaeia archaeon]|nr:helix-turn-helix domain-containing protein [Candidatus Nanoarchaeia archaeon]